MKHGKPDMLTSVWHRMHTQLHMYVKGHTNDPYGTVPVIPAPHCGPTMLAYCVIQKKDRQDRSDYFITVP